MPVNQPTVTTNRISFGPAVVFLGVMGATPTTDLGAIKTDDGVTLEVTSEKRDIMQGNPKLIEYTFVQAQGAALKFSGLEWDISQTFYRALGSGVTSTSGSNTRIYWGGDPLVTQVAIHVRHYMAISGQTMNIYAWKCVADAPPKFMFGHDEHSFDLSFKLQRAATDWVGTALASTSQLFQIHHQTA